MHRAALRIVEQLAAGDGSRLVYQHNLATGHSDIAKLLIAQGDSLGALGTAHRPRVCREERLHDGVVVEVTATTDAAGDSAA